MSIEYENLKVKNIEIARHRINLQDSLIQRDQWQTCINCDDFVKETEECKMHKARPPAYIIVSGCENHTMAIPF